MEQMFGACASSPGPPRTAKTLDSRHEKRTRRPFLLYLRQSAVCSVTAAGTAAAALTTATAATTSVAAATTSAAEAAGARGTRFHRTRFVDDQATAADLLAVHAFDGSLGFSLGAHFDETETFGAAGVTFHHDFGAGHGAVLA